MIQNQTILQFCIYQNRFLDALEQVQSSVHSTYQKLKKDHSPKLEKTTERFLSLRNKLEKEFQALSKIVHESRLGQIDFHKTWDDVSLKAQELKDSLALRYQEWNHDDLKKALQELEDQIQVLRAEVKGIDLKSALGNLSNKVLVDHYDSLGEQKRVQWHRKMLHIGAALFIVGIYLFSRGTMTAKMTIFGSFTVYIFICDALRFISPTFNSWVMRDLNKYMRKEEANRMNSMVFYAVSSFLVCLLFPKGPAILSILFLGFGDPAASIVGSNWGKHKLWKHTSLEGSLAFFTVCFLLSFLYPLLTPDFHGSILLFAFFGGLIGMISEWTAYRVDDNFMIPMVSAIGLTLLGYFLS